MLSLLVFPRPLLGNSEALWLDEDVCFERHGRFGAYGLSANDNAANNEPLEMRP